MKKRPIRTTGELTEIITKAVPRTGRLHPATKTFMALRIYTNQELENLELILGSLEKILAPAGRAAIISYHSLEDRLVKNYFRKYVQSGQVELLTKKPIIPTTQETRENPRSRSAKLRALKFK